MGKLLYSHNKNVIQKMVSSQFDNSRTVFHQDIIALCEEQVEI